MFIADHARDHPDHAALIDAASGERVTFRALDERSNRLAQLFHAQGLRRGDHIALFMENHVRFMEVCWAAARSGLYYTTVNRYLTAEEAAYIVNDCGAKALVSSLARAEVAGPLAAMIPACKLRLMVDGVLDGWTSYEDAVATQPATPLAREWLGEPMLYSSGTTGRPKGIKRPPQDVTVGEDVRWRDTARGYGFGADTVYLSPAPLYHAAPISYAMTVQRVGGTVVMMRRFDALEVAAADRAVPRHPQPMGADDVRAHAEAARGRARALRPVQPPRRDPCRRTLPGGGQAPDDRLVGADHPRVLRRHRTDRHHPARQHRVARTSGLGRPRGARRPAHLRR